MRNYKQHLSDKAPEGFSVAQATGNPSRPRGGESDKCGTTNSEGPKSAQINE